MQVFAKTSFSTVLFFFVLVAPSFAQLSSTPTPQTEQITQNEGTNKVSNIATYQKSLQQVRLNREYAEAVRELIIQANPPTPDQLQKLQKKYDGHLTTSINYPDGEGNTQTLTLESPLGNIQTLEFNIEQTRTFRAEKGKAQRKLVEQFREIYERFYQYGDLEVPDSVQLTFPKIISQAILVLVKGDP